MVCLARLSGKLVNDADAERDTAKDKTPNSEVREGRGIAVGNNEKRIEGIDDTLTKTRGEPRKGFDKGGYDIGCHILLLYIFIKENFVVVRSVAPSAMLEGARCTADVMISVTLLLGVFLGDKGGCRFQSFSAVRGVRVEKMQEVEGLVALVDHFVTDDFVIHTVLHVVLNSSARHL